MAEGLEKARTIADTMRFSGDVWRKNAFNADLSSEKLFSLHNGIKVNERLTPIVYKTLTTVFDRLWIPNKTIDTYIYNSAEAQATCALGDGNTACIRISSGLITLLSQQELEFVIGHEIGHFLFMHSNKSSEPTLQDLIDQRSQEISADRIGLQACESLEVAIRTLMKTASGLTSEYLRFDVGEFISQIRLQEKKPIDLGFTLTHPTILIRCRALLWFSLYAINSNRNNTKSLKEIDILVENDLTTFIDRSAKEEISKRTNDLEMWIKLKDVVMKGAFTKLDQIEFGKKYGQGLLNKTMWLLKSNTPDDILVIVQNQIEQSMDSLSLLSPRAVAALQQKSG